MDDQDGRPPLRGLFFFVVSCVVFFVFLFILLVVFCIFCVFCVTFVFFVFFVGLASGFDVARFAWVFEASTSGRAYAS